jgi:FAD/FMN-containing dehydrogenase
MNTISPSADANLVPPGLAGRFVTPADSDFNQLNTLVYGGFTAIPAGIVRADSTDDVVRTVNHAREMNVPLAIRSGGHSLAGHSTVDGGLVLDLRGLKGIDIDAAGRTAWADGGVTALELLEALAPHKLVVGFGDTDSVGISGITLGGGIGYLTRKYGMTVDAVLAVELVTAAGELLVADPDNHSDLFWALRGGGGNFGVVTRIKYRLSPLEHFTGGMLVLPATPETVLGFVAAAEAADENLSTIANVMAAPPMPFLPPDMVGKLIILSTIAYAGSDEEAQKAIAPFRALAKPLADFIRPGEYHQVMFPPENGEYHPTAAALNLFVDEFGPMQAATIVDYLAKGDAPFRVTQIRALGGAAARIANDATAYGHRDRGFMLNLAAFHDGTPADRARKLAWVQEFGRALNSTDKAAYVNFLDNEGPERVRAAYPGAIWDRLRQVKRQYDPQNLFHANQNIPPA